MMKPTKAVKSSRDKNVAEILKKEFMCNNAKIKSDIICQEIFNAQVPNVKKLQSIVNPMKKEIKLIGKELLKMKNLEISIKESDWYRCAWKNIKFFVFIVNQLSKDSACKEKLMKIAEKLNFRRPNSEIQLTPPTINQSDNNAIVRPAIIMPIINRNDETQSINQFNNNTELNQFNGVPFIYSPNEISEYNQFNEIPFIYSPNEISEYDQFNEIPFIYSPNEISEFDQFNDASLIFSPNEISEFDQFNDASLIFSPNEAFGFNQFNETSSTESKNETLVADSNEHHEGECQPNELSNSSNISKGKTKSLNEQICFKTDTPK